ncbi:MAG: hypothetical protein KDD66_03980 [Bdellovibrionales bacterium]|nr:hypothetical protein [Bdellovibrionales bacterium]
MVLLAAFHGEGCLVPGEGNLVHATVEVERTVLGLERDVLEAETVTQHPVDISGLTLEAVELNSVASDGNEFGAGIESVLARRAQNRARSETDLDVDEGARRIELEDVDAVLRDQAGIPAGFMRALDHPGIDVDQTADVVLGRVDRQRSRIPLEHLDRVGLTIGTNHAVADSVAIGVVHLVPLALVLGPADGTRTFAARRNRGEGEAEMDAERPVRFDRNLVRRTAAEHHGEHGPQKHQDCRDPIHCKPFCCLT